jgi:hypothetical protein
MKEMEGIHHVLELNVEFPCYALFKVQDCKILKYILNKRSETVEVRGYVRCLLQCLPVLQLLFVLTDRNFII